MLTRVLAIGACVREQICI